MGVSAPGQLASARDQPPSVLGGFEGDRIGPFAPALGWGARLGGRPSGHGRVTLARLNLQQTQKGGRYYLPR